MRLKNLTKSVSIILMLLAMMFSCDQITGDIDSGNSNSNNTNQGGNTGGDNTGNGNGGGNTGGGNNEEDKPANPQALTLQQIINDTNAGEEIDLSKYKDVTDYSATVNKTLTIKNGSLSNAKLIVTAENVKLEKLEKVSVSTSSRLTINNSKLSDLLIGANSEMSRSGTLSTEMSLAMASITGCEIENVELIGFNSQLNITDVKTKINDIVTSTKAKIVLEAGSYEGMKDPTVTDDGELTRIDMTKEKELSVLSIYSNPKKAEYQIGEVLDVTGLVVMGTYTASIEVFKSGGWKGEAVDSVTKWEDEKDYTVTCEDFSTAGVKIVTITSNVDTKVKCNFYVYVKDAQNTEIKEPEITDITPKSLGTPKTLYRVGEKLDLSWIQVVGTYNDLKINLAYTSEPANGTTLTTVGETTVTLYYNDEKIAEFPIIVENSFTVKFYDGIDNSKPLYTQKVTAGNSLKLPSLPERENFTFVGWYDGETKIESGYPVTENLELIAKWYEVTVPEMAAGDAAKEISELSEGAYTIKVTGEMTPDILASIAESMKNNTSAEIALDLSGTTGLTEIPDQVFSMCSNLTSIIIPDGVITIGNITFYFCSNLTSVTIPESVTTVGYSAFDCCSNLTSVITIGKNLTFIGNAPFSGTKVIFDVDENNANYSSSEDGKILYNKDKTMLIVYPSATGDIAIPNGVTSIGNSAFGGCSGLTSVTIPDSVTSIGGFAFNGCSSLTSFTIPGNVTKIDQAAFQDCGFTSVTFADTTTWYYTDNDDYTGGTKIDVTDLEQNAYNLSIDKHLCYSYWYKIEKCVYISGLNGENWATGEDFGTADCMTPGENDIYTFTFIAESINPFPYGFNFVTENGLEESYQAYNEDNPTSDYTILQPDQEADVYFAVRPTLYGVADNATKFSLGSSKFKVGNGYTITFDKANMTVKVSGEFDVLQMKDITVTIVINENANLILTDVPTYNVDDTATIDGSLFSWCFGEAETLKSTDCTINANWTGAEENTWVEEEAPATTVEGADAWAKLFFSADSSQGWIPYSTTGDFTYSWNDKK